MIELDQFSVSRGGQVVVRDVTIAADLGEAIGVIGPNGGGKSTLLAGARGLLESSGSVRIADRDARQESRRSMAKLVATVPQRMEFSFPYRVDEMVLFGRAPYRRPWEPFSATDRRLAAEAIERAGIGHVRSRRVDELSGGERRRVFLARALAQATPVLFLDEPTAGLDPAAQEELVAVIDELRRDAAKTLIVVVHDVRIAQRTCDRVLGLADGSPRFYGAPERVIDATSLESLYGVPWRVVGNEEEGSVFLPRAAALRTTDRSPTSEGEA